MKKVGSVLLSIVFAIALLCTLLLGIVRTEVNGGTIATLLSNMLVGKTEVQVPDNGVYYPEYGKQIVPADYDFSDLGDLESFDVDTIIKGVSEEYGIDLSEEVVKEILNSPETVEFLNKYTEQVVDYMAGNTTEFAIDPEDVKKVVNNGITVYEKATGEKVDTTGLDEIIEAGIEEAAPAITQGLDEAKEEMGADLDVLKKVNILLSFKTFLVALGICIILAALIFVINMNVAAMMKYISIPGMVDGVLIFAAAFGIKAAIPFIKPELEDLLPANVIDAILKLIEKIASSINAVGMITFGVSIIILVVGIILGNKQKSAE